MLIAVVVLFTLAALIGLRMAIIHFRGKTPPPVALAVWHGVFVASGLVLLLVGLWLNFSVRAVWAFGLLILAALGGLWLALGFHYRGKPLSSDLVELHGMLAVFAFLILLTAAFDF